MTFQQGITDPTGIQICNFVAQLAHAASLIDPVGVKCSPRKPNFQGCARSLLNWLIIKHKKVNKSDIYAG
jgi:hypothetical protein